MSAPVQSRVSYTTASGDISQNIVLNQTPGGMRTVFFLVPFKNAQPSLSKNVQ